MGTNQQILARELLIHFNFDSKSDEHIVIVGSDLGFAHDVICLCSYVYVCSVRKDFNSKIKDQYQSFRFRCEMPYL